jgi:hypothetical protein
MLVARVRNWRALFNYRAGDLAVEDELSPARHMNG